MGELIGLLIIVGLLISWIIAGANYFRADRALTFFGHLGCCAALVVLFWALIVYPVLHCSGFLCGLTEILLFVFLSGATVLVWGLILLIYSNKNFKQKEKLYTGEHESIDEEGPQDEMF